MASATIQPVYVDDIDGLALSAQAGDNASFSRLASAMQALFAKWANVAAKRTLRGGQGHGVLGGSIGDNINQSTRDFDFDWHLSEANFALVKLISREKGFDPARGPFIPFIKLAVLRRWRKGTNGKQTWKDHSPMSAIGDQSLLDNITEDSAAREVGSQVEARDAVEKILEKIPESQADLIKLVYGIGVMADGQPRTPRPVKQLEKAHGFSRNSLHERLATAKKNFRNVAEQEGMFI